MSSLQGAVGQIFSGGYAPLTEATGRARIVNSAAPHSDRRVCERTAYGPRIVFHRTAETKSGKRGAWPLSCLLAAQNLPRSISRAE